MTIYTKGDDVYGWIRTRKCGLGPVKVTTCTTEATIADASKAEVFEFMLHEACADASGMLFGTVKKIGSGKVKITSPGTVITYELCHWKHVM
jgi:hypothetical protein